MIATGRGRRGFVLWTTAGAAIAMIGMLGLAVDVGRMYIVKNELQTYADSAALAAALELDGTSAGLNSALAAVTAAANNNRWNFGSAIVPAPVTDFAKVAAGPWDAAPSPATGYRYARVTAAASVPLLFLRGIVGRSSSQLSAVSAAGQLERDSVSKGALPFSPGVHSPTGPDYGFQKGRRYALRWGDKNGCEGDAGYTPVSVGYWGDNASNVLWEAILNGSIDPVSKHDVLLMPTGQRESVIRALRQRVNMDTDPTSATYAQYAAAGTGNGIRVGVAPINQNDEVVGFAGFFLLPASEYPTGGQTAICAEYIGSFLRGAGGPGTGTTGYSEVRLTQ